MFFCFVLIYDSSFVKMESPEDEWNRVRVGFIVWVVLVIIIIVIYVVYIRKNNFECRHSSSFDGKCFWADCPRGESWDYSSQKCGKSFQDIVNTARTADLSNPYGNMWNPNSPNHNLSLEELRRIANYDPQMFNNLPAGVSPPPKTY